MYTQMHKIMVTQQSNMSDMENLEVNKVLRADNTDFIKSDQENSTMDFFFHGEVSHAHNFLVFIKFWLTWLLDL